MKKIAIQSISISNFKGIKQLDVDFSATATNIYGDNATGKTTIFDGFMWLMFDKDSKNAKQFNIKPLDKDGNLTQKGIEPTVSAVLSAGGKTFELKKAYTEIWTKKRGSANAVLTGHETKYSIDDVPKKKSEYEEYIKQLLDEKIFRLLTDVLYFNTQLHWADRRKILLEMCGDITDGEVINSDVALSPLAVYLDKYSMDDFKKKLAADRARINKAREELPIRIDEAYKSIVDVDEAKERMAVSQLEEKLSSLEVEKTMALGSNKQERELRETENKIVELHNKNTQFKLSAKEAYNALYLDAIEERNDLEHKINILSAEIISLENTKNAEEKSASELRKKYGQISEEKWVGETICPTCNQSYPEDKLNEGIEHFNIEKSKRLQEIQITGKTKVAEINKLTGEISNKETKKSKLVRELEKIVVPASTVPEDMPGYAETLEKLLLQKEEILKSKGAETESTSDVTSRINEVKGKIEEHMSSIALANNNLVIKNRIAELEYQEKCLAEEMEQTDKNIYLAEEFVKTKVAMLESKINSKFKLARFKLFGEQINGGITECCEAMYEGVPYSDLNSAMRINIGLDIASALSEYYGVTAPIFVDNAESVTRLIDGVGQIVRLVVSREDKALRIEGLKFEEVA